MRQQVFLGSLAWVLSALAVQGPAQAQDAAQTAEDGRDTTSNWTLPVALAFHGVARAQSRQTTALEFTGVASDPGKLTASLAFDGVNTELGPVAGSVSFQGVNADMGPVGGAMAFHGVNTELGPIGGAMAFAGVASDLGPVSGQMQFTGMGAAAPHLDQPPSIYGNWQVEWSNDQYSTPGLMTIYQSETGGVLVSGTRVRDNRTDAISSRAVASVSGDAYKIAWAYGHLGYWGGEAIVRPSSPDQMTGRWGYRCEDVDLLNCQQGGTSSWTRILPKFDRHLPLSRPPDGLFGAISSTPLPRTPKQAFNPAQPITLIAPTTAPDQDGFVGHVYLAVYGKDIFGPQSISVQGPSGLTFSSYSYICAFDGSAAQNQLHWSQQVCENQGGIQGLYMALNVWSDATHNGYDLIVQGETLPLFLVVAD